MLKIEFRYLLCVMLAIGLFGCGQMGPLVMPPSEDAVNTSQTPKPTPIPTIDHEMPDK